jgi:hypothetical protein
MSCHVAVPASGYNVSVRISPAILLGLQVLGSKLKTRDGSLAHFIFGGKFSRLLQPHWSTAVKATAILAFECGETVFGN